jgi:hypothetical protein
MKNQTNDNSPQDDAEKQPEPIQIVDDRPNYAESVVAAAEKVAAYARELDSHTLTLSWSILTREGFSTASTRLRPIIIRMIMRWPSESRSLFQTTCCSKSIMMGYAG